MRASINKVVAIPKPAPDTKRFHLGWDPLRNLEYSHRAPINRITMTIWPTSIPTLNRNNGSRMLSPT